MEDCSNESCFSDARDWLGRSVRRVSSTGTGFKFNLELDLNNRGTLPKVDFEGSLRGVSARETDIRDFNGLFVACLSTVANVGVCLRDQLRGIALVAVCFNLLEGLSSLSSPIRFPGDSFL